MIEGVQINASLGVRRGGETVALVGRSYPSVGWTIVGVVFAGTWAALFHPRGIFGRLTTDPEMPGFWLNEETWWYGFPLVAATLLAMILGQVRARRTPFAVASAEEISFPRQSRSFRRTDVSGVCAIRRLRSSRKDPDHHVELLFALSVRRDGDIHLHPILQISSWSARRASRRWARAAGLEDLGVIACPDDAPPGARTTDLAREVLRVSAPFPAEAPPDRQARTSATGPAS